MSRLHVLAVALLVAPLADHVMAQAAEYDLIYLRPPGDDISNIYAYDLDSAGNVLLSTTQPWSVDPGGSYIYERATNSFRQIASRDEFIIERMTDAGEFVGLSVVEPEDVALYWPSETADPIPLAPLSGDEISYADDINNAGVMVGVSGLTDYTTYGPVAWVVTESGPSDAVPLPGLAGYAASAEVVGEPNADGIVTIIGEARELDTGEPRGVSWIVCLDEGQLEILAGPIVLAGQSPGVLTRPEGVNSRGDIVGDHWQEFQSRAFGIPAGGNLIFLAQPKVGSYRAKQHKAYAVNDLRDVVGTATFRVKKKNHERAILWRGGTNPIDLNSAVEITENGFLTSASRINNAGMIVANGQFPELVIDRYVPCLLIPK